MNHKLYLAILRIEANNCHYDRIEANGGGIYLDIDLEEIEAHAEMYNEHCFRVIGIALQARNPFNSHFYDPNY